MIMNGEVNEREVEGVRVYSVPRPEEGEEVVGYVNFANMFISPTETEAASSDFWDMYAQAFPPDTIEEPSMLEEI